MTPEPRRSAGWYDDETDAALLRYWDGAKWSPHTAPRPAPADTHEQVAALFRHDEPVPAMTVTMPLRSPDEHTTVPLPEEPTVPGPRGRRWRVGGRR